MLNLKLAYDASRPPATAFPGAVMEMGYLGGNTPHIWTLDEWNSSSDRGHLVQVGIWVVDFTESIGSFGMQGIRAADAARALGWAHDGTRAIVIDGETSTNVAAIRSVGEAMAHAGYIPVDYRSADPQRQAPSGYLEWTARWLQSPGPFSGMEIGFQIAADIGWENTQIDISIVSQEFMNLAGVNIRHNEP